MKFYESNSFNLKLIPLISYTRNPIAFQWLSEKFQFLLHRKLISWISENPTSVHSSVDQYMAEPFSLHRQLICVNETNYMTNLFGYRCNTL